MAASANFAGHAIRQRMCFKPSTGLTLSSLPPKEPFQLKQKTMKVQLPYGIGVHRQNQKKLFTQQRLHSVTGAAHNSDSTPSLSSVSDMIKRFYTCINEKNLRELDNYIADDCWLEECSFPNTIHEKREVVHFLEQLTACMGQNVRFHIEDVCEDDQLTCGVNWHLEWKDSPIPFTRGCSFYKCSKEGGTLVIKKGRIVIESPIKPGGVVLILLKNVTSLFDDFPKATEWFLRSPHVIIHFLLRLYTMLMAPFINPLISGYIRIWNCIAQMLAFIINVILYISKIFSR